MCEVMIVFKVVLLSPLWPIPVTRVYSSCFSCSPLPPSLPHSFLPSFPPPLPLTESCYSEAKTPSRRTYSSYSSSSSSSRSSSSNQEQAQEQAQEQEQEQDP